MIFMKNKKRAEFIETSNVWYFNNNVGLSIYLQRGVLVI